MLNYTIKNLRLAIFPESLIITKLLHTTACPFFTSEYYAIMWTY